ncbi:MAG: class II SORL domain-containing protein [Thermoplasmata archaeon]
MPIEEHLGKADWKKEKHVPVIECPDRVRADENFGVNVSIGKEIDHPKTTAHHIRWIALYFHPDGEKFSYQVARCEFAAHGESTEGPDTSSVYTHHAMTAWMKTKKSGTLYAVSFCNIHGLWQGEKKVAVG